MGRRIWGAGVKFTSDATRRGPRWLLTLALGAGAWLAAAPAEASGFSVARFGGEHGHPMTTNGTSLYYNPAGFAASEGTHVYLDVTTAWRSASYQHTEAPSDYSQTGSRDVSVARDANTHEGKVFNVIPSPGAFLTTKFGDLGLALGFFTPFGGSARWSKNEALEGHSTYQGLSDGGQRWYTIDGELRTSYLSLGVGYHLKDLGLSFGLAANAQLSSVKTLRARNANGTDNIVREGRSYLDASGLDFSLGLGVRYATEDDGWVVGASWQSAPNFDGEQRMSGTLTNIYGPADARTGGSTGDTDFTGALPNVFRLGVEHRASERIALRLFGDYQTWSALKNHCVLPAGETCDILPDGSDAAGVTTVNQPRHWRDTFGVRVGASYFLQDGPELFWGIGYASNGIDDEYLEPALMDFNAMTPVAGVRFQVVDALALAVSYTQVIYFSRDNSGKSTLDEQVAPSAGPDAGGKYSQSIGVLNVGADLKF